MKDSKSSEKKIEKKVEKKIEKKTLKQKFNYTKRKENLLCSLSEAENFLCDYKKLCKGINLYKFLK